MKKFKGDKISKKKLATYVVIAIITSVMYLVFCTNLTVAQEGYEVRLLHYEPFPIKPSTDFEAWFKVSNLGNDELNDVTIKALSEFPFYVIGNDTIHIDKIRGRDYVIFKFRFRTDANAVQGDNKLYLKIGTGNSAVIKKSFNVLISSQNPSLSIKEIDVEPKAVVGKEFNVRIYLANSDKTTLRNVRVFLDLSQLPFTPIDGTNVKTIDTMIPKEQVTLNYQLISDPDSNPGIYKLPITITYQDSLGNTYSSNQIIGIILKDPVNQGLEPIIEYTTLKQNSENTITIKFVNKGLSKIKSLLVTIEPDQSYEIVGTNKQYIGSIASDDYDSADFKIIPKNNKVNIKIKYSYLDSDNNPIEKEESFEVNANVVNEIKHSNHMGIVLSILIVIIIVLIYLVWRKR